MTDTLLYQSEGWAESEAVEPHARHEPGADGRAAVHGVVVPAATAVDAPGRTSSSLIFVIH